jgi:copper(I)-binding protein
MKTTFKLSALSMLIALCAAAQAQSAIDIQGAWVRATVPGQMATGAFMRLTAKEGASLVGVSSPVVGVAEVHAMNMVGDVMQMRAVQGGLDLPAGKAVELKPGGYHLMLMDLKTPLLKGSKLPLTLLFKDAKGVQTQVELSVPVSVSAPNGAGAPH